MASNSTISITFKLNGDNKSFKELVNDSEGLKKALNSAAVEAEKLPKSLNKTKFSAISKDLAGIAVGFLSVKAAIGGLKSAAGTIIEFERANSELASVLGKSTEEVGKLTTAAQELGRTTEFSAKEVTALQTSLARLGFNDAQILDMEESVLKFAAATGTDLASAADFAGSALRSFGLSAADTPKMLDVMAASTSKSALSFGKLQASLSTVGPVAKAFGMSAADTVSLLGVLSNAGFDASSAATALRNIFLNLSDSNGKLVRGLGHTAKTMPEIIDALTELRDRGISLNETLEMTDKRSVAAFQALVSGADDVAALYKELNNANGALDTMYTTMTDNVAGSIKSLKSAWEGFVLSFSQSTGPMKSVFDWMAGQLNKLTSMLPGTDLQNQRGGKSWFKDMEDAFGLNDNIEGPKSSDAIKKLGDKLASDVASAQRKERQAVDELKSAEDDLTAAKEAGDKKLIKQAEASVKRLQEKMGDAQRLVKMFQYAVDEYSSKYGEKTPTPASVPTATGAGPKPAATPTSSVKSQGVDLSGVREDIEAVKALTTETEALEDQAWAAVGAFMALNDIKVNPTAKFDFGFDPEKMFNLGNEDVDLGFLDDLQDGLDEVTKSAMKGARAALGGFSDSSGIEGTTDALTAMAGAFGSLGQVMSDSADSWMSWIANVLRAVAQAVPAIGTLTSALAGKAVAEGSSAVAGVPVVGPALAVAAAATIGGAIASVIGSLPKFAEGGIAYGPTVGLFGEYAGASRNPEVVAPLDKLRGMLFDGEDGQPGAPKVVDLRLRRNELHALIEIDRDMRGRN